MLYNSDTGPRVLQPLAVLAALEGHSENLRLCLDNGAVIDRHLARAIGKGKLKDPEMVDATAPYKAQIEELSRGRKGADGQYTDEQLEEWFGDIEW